MRIDIRRIGAIKQTDGAVTGNRTKLKVVKNKVAPPFTEAEFDIMYNEGISTTGSLLDLALEKNIIEKRGTWLCYKGSQLAQGRDAAKELLKRDPAIYAEIEAAVLAALERWQGRRVRTSHGAVVATAPLKSRGGLSRRAALFFLLRRICHPDAECNAVDAHLPPREACRRLENVSCADSISLPRSRKASALHSDQEHKGETLALLARRPLAKLTQRCPVRYRMITMISTSPRPPLGP